MGVWNVACGARLVMVAVAAEVDTGPEVKLVVDETEADAVACIDVALATADVVGGEEDSDADWLADWPSAPCASSDDQSSLFSGTAAALKVSVHDTAFSRYRTSFAVMTSLPLIQTLNPPSLTPGVLSQMSCLIVVQSPFANVQAPRPMDRPYSELQID
jgi:hypothetical protein